MGWRRVNLSRKCSNARFPLSSNQQKDDDDGEKYGPGPKRRFLFWERIASAAVNALFLVRRQNAPADLTILGRDLRGRHNRDPETSWKRNTQPDDVFLRRCMQKTARSGLNRNVT